MVSEPPDPATPAVSLVHEFQHIKLGALMHLISLVTGDDGTPYYAPWRDDPSPLGGFLQGVCAFFGIAEFWRRRRPATDGFSSRAGIRTPVLTSWVRCRYGIARSAISHEGALTWR
jgi:HEXXH motif-containing protein